MAIKLSTQDKINTVMAGHDDWACIGMSYSDWTVSCICGHAIKTIFIIGHAGDHGPAYNQPTFYIGSECFKYLNADPKFRALSEDLQAKLAEIHKIQRRMKKDREDIFHASKEWREIAKKLCPLQDIFRLVDIKANNYLRVVYFDPNTVPFDTRCNAHISVVSLSKINMGDKRFQDLETAQEYLKTTEMLGVQVLDALLPSKPLLEKFVSMRDGRICMPGVSNCMAALKMMEK